MKSCIMEFLLQIKSTVLFQVQQWPLRVLGADDVQVDVTMCGMNFADLYMRQGLLREKQPPFVLGMECAGEVVKVGERVTHIKVFNYKSLLSFD